MKGEFEMQGSGDESGVSRWGGLAGILGSLLFIVVFVIVGVFVGLDPVEGAESVTRFPDIRAARTVENSLYLLVLLLWVPHFLALYRALRRESLAPALFGVGLGLVGLAVLAAGALPHVATLPISDLYHEAGATPEEQSALVLIWQATEGLFDALFVAGLITALLGIVSLGVAAMRAPAFGRGYGWVSLVLGILGLAGAAFLLIDPQSPSAFAGVLALILFHLVVGWRMYRLSNAL